jgi:hypothetical protein
MSDPQPQFDPPRTESSSERADGARSLPAWNRERLIEQFLQIDPTSSRSEAERQIAAFELSFWRRVADSPSAAPEYRRVTTEFGHSGGA